jgi:TPR repeat protein
VWKSTVKFKYSYREGEEVNKCFKCGTPIGSTASFCTNCGAKLEGRCSNCGALLNEDAKFCGVCGTQVQPSPIAVHADIVSAKIDKDEDTVMMRAGIVQLKEGSCAAVSEDTNKKNITGRTHDERGNENIGLCNEKNIPVTITPSSIGNLSFLKTKKKYIAAIFLIVFALIGGVIAYRQIISENTTSVSVFDLKDYENPEQAYKEAEQAMSDYDIMNWDIENEHDDEDFDKLWQKAREGYKFAAYKGNSKLPKSDYAQFLLYECNGHYSEAAADEAIKFLKILAADGDAKFEYILADAYLLKAKNGPEAQKELNIQNHSIWHAKAAEHGHPAALRDRAILLQKAGDMTKALKFYEKAAESVDTYDSKYENNYTQLDIALYSLTGQRGFNLSMVCKAEIGYIYEFGILGIKDFKKALYWYEKTGSGHTDYTTDSVLAESDSLFYPEEAIERVKEKMKH